MQDTQAHGPAKNDHVHDAVPLETAFDFLNTYELEGDAYVDRLTSLDAAADWLVENRVVRNRRSIARPSGASAGRSALDRITRTRTALWDVAHAGAHQEAPDQAAIHDGN